KPSHTRTSVDVPARTPPVAAFIPDAPRDFTPPRALWLRPQLFQTNHHRGPGLFCPKRGVQLSIFSKSHCPESWSAKIPGPKSSGYVSHFYPGGVGGHGRPRGERWSVALSGDAATAEISGAKIRSY